MTGAIRIPDGFVDEIKARLNPSDVIGRKVKLRKQGKEWVGLSPFTNEKTPSFYVNDQKKMFKCFSSGKGGDILAFVMETERLSFLEAVEKLAEEAGLSLPKASAEDQATYSRTQRLLAVCESAASYYETQLRERQGGPARDYLQKRGLPPQSWSRYRLGYAPDDWRQTYQHLHASGFTQSEITEAGLAVDSQKSDTPYDRFRGRLMFPIEDRRGQVIAFGGRALNQDTKPKYLNSSDTPLFQKSHILYRYKAAREAYGESAAEGLIVCEGYMDVIALCEAGIAYAVAPLGTALTDTQLELLWRAGPEPVLCFDGDRAGLDAAHRSIDRALPGLQPGRSVFFSLLPDGLDPDELIQTQGVAAMHQALQNPMPLVELLWQRERDAEQVNTPERQAGLEQRLMQAAGVIRHSTVRAAYERDLRRRMKDYLWQRGTVRRQTGAFQAGQIDPRQKVTEMSRLRGLGNLVRAIDNPHLIETGFEALAAAEFSNPDISQIREALLTLYQAESGVDRSRLNSHLIAQKNMRAAELLTTYPDVPDIVPGGPEEREWLIALEQYVRSDGPEGPGSVSGEAFATAEDARLRHRLVSERQARATRLSEAAEKADQD